MATKDRQQEWKTVSGTLNDSVGLQKFKEFQNRRDAESSKGMVLNCLEFYEKCEVHKSLEDEKQLRNSAESIFEEHLREMAPKEIPDMGNNESYNVRNKLDNKGLSIDDLKNIFNKKQMDLYRAIEDDQSHDLFYKEICKKTCVLM